MARVSVPPINADVHYKNPQQHPYWAIHMELKTLTDNIILNESTYVHYMRIMLKIIKITYRCGPIRRDFRRRFGMHILPPYAGGDDVFSVKFNGRVYFVEVEGTYRLDENGIVRLVSESKDSRANDMQHMVSQSCMFTL
jgi:hypothetical protein